MTRSSALSIELRPLISDAGILYNTRVPRHWGDGLKSENGENTTMNTKLVIALTALNVSATLATAAMLAVGRAEWRDAEARIAESEKACKKAAESAFKAYQLSSSEHIQTRVESLRGQLGRMKEDGARIEAIAAAEERLASGTNGVGKSSDSARPRSNVLRGRGVRLLGK